MVCGHCIQIYLNNVMAALSTSAKAVELATSGVTKFTEAIYLKACLAFLYLSIHPRFTTAVNWVYYDMELRCLPKKSHHLAHEYLVKPT